MKRVRAAIKEGRCEHGDCMSYCFKFYNNKKYCTGHHNKLTKGFTPKAKTGDRIEAYPVDAPEQVRVYQSVTAAAADVHTKHNRITAMCKSGVDGGSIKVGRRDSGQRLWHFKYAL